MKLCRWARCCGDQAADGLQGYLVVSGGSAWLKGWGRPGGAWHYPFLLLFSYIRNFKQVESSPCENSLLCKKKRDRENV